GASVGLKLKPRQLKPNPDMPLIPLMALPKLPLRPVMPLMPLPKLPPWPYIPKPLPMQPPNVGHPVIDEKHGWIIGGGLGLMLMTTRATDPGNGLPSARRRVAVMGCPTSKRACGSSSFQPREARSRG